MKKISNGFPLLKNCYVFFVFASLLSCSISGVFAQSIPRHEEFFGFPVGADHRLIDYQQAVAYWKKLEENSGRIKIFDYGKTSRGKTMMFAAVSSEENILQLDHYKSISKSLSLVRDIRDEDAQNLAEEGKAIV